MKTNRATFILLIATLLISFSCHKNKFDHPDVIPTNLEELVVSSDFAWRVKESVEVNISLPFDGYVQISSTEGDVVFAKGISKEKMFSKIIVVPTFIETVNVDFNGYSLALDLNGEVVDFTFPALKSVLLIDNLVDNSDFSDVTYSYLSEINLQSNISSSNLDNWILKEYQNNKPNAEIYFTGSDTVVKMTDNKNNKDAFAYYYLEADPNVEFTLEVNAILVEDDDDLEPYIALQFMNSNGQEIVSYDLEVTSLSWTTYTITQNSPIGTAYIKIVMATSVSGKGEAHFDDVVLTTVSNDDDNDGVINEFDNFPLDPTRAFINYYPADSSGRLAFEDTWPAKADYDFNDMVIDYRFSVITNASDYVVEIIGAFSIANIGAAYTNGFGFQLPNNSASWYSTVSGVVGNSFENGQTYPTVILFSTSNHSNEGIQDTVVLTLNSNTATDLQVAIQDWNPFLIGNGQRGVEIHLAYYPPTDLANLSLFGTNFDDGNPNDWNGTKIAGLSKSYLTSNNLPWGIDVGREFNWTLEREPINTGHLHFIDWAASTGTDYQDWYYPNGNTGSKTGYRNNSKIDTN
ncbi:MAG: LruC domain-containing protein [Bacteroidales bacterium]|nr:LruC domain-containing protein [Bacteroidales bacterium]MCF8457059.1 LruC domain-containing protein [Bacteroidales bacterium]